MGRLAELKEAQEKYRTRAFWMMLEIAVIFGVPAAGAFFGGVALDRAHGGRKTYSLVLLGIAFVFSWVITIIRWRKLDRKMREIDRAARDERERRSVGGLLTPIREDPRDHH